MVLKIKKNLIFFNALLKKTFLKSIMRRNNTRHIRNTIYILSLFLRFWKLLIFFTLNYIF
jgi:hypothetical protein